jgi:hypothetical protein
MVDHSKSVVDIVIDAATYIAQSERDICFLKLAFAKVNGDASNVKDFGVRRLTWFPPT